MSKTYRAWDPNQTYLLPPSPRDWLPDDDLVYFMLDVVQTLDLSAITVKYEKEDRGSPPYHPRMMVALLLYSYCVGVYSSRRIQKRCERDAAYRVIVGDDVPNFRTIYRIEKSRGKDVVFDTLGASFGGVLVSDCLASYENLPFTMHKCYGHHLKAIAEARDRKPEDQRVFFRELTALLRSAMALDRLRQDLPPPEFARIRQHLDDRADVLLGPTRSDPDEERIANRLRKRRRWLFTFLDYAEVEATNNRAERALRPAVIARKLSCGNKTERGKRTWEILASLAATCHQRGQDLVEHLRPCLLLTPPIQSS